MSRRSSNKRHNPDDAYDDGEEHDDQPQRSTRSRGGVADDSMIRTIPRESKRRKLTEETDERKIEEVEDEDEDDDVSMDDTKAPAGRPAMRRLGSVDHPSGRTISSLRGRSTGTHEIIDVEDEEAKYRSNAKSSHHRRGKISMMDEHTMNLDGPRARRGRPPKNYTEPTVSDLFRTPKDITPTPSRATRMTRRSNGVHEEESDEHSRPASTSPNRRNTPRQRQRITREKAKEMGVSFEELQRMSGLDSVEDGHEEHKESRRPTRSNSNTPPAASSSAAPASSSTPAVTASVSEDESVPVTRRRTTRSRAIRDDEEDEYNDDQEDEESSDSSSSEESEMRPAARPRREATRIGSYAEGKLAREQLRRGRGDQSGEESADGEEHPGRAKGEQVMTSYFRELKQEKVRLVDGREVSMREYRMLQRSGEQVRTLEEGEEPDGDGTAVHHSPSHPGARRSGRRTTQVEHFRAGGEARGSDDDGDEKPQSYAARRRPAGANKNRRGGRSRGRHARPMHYGESSTSSSDSSDSSDDPGQKDRRRTNRDRRSIQPLHLQIQHAMRKLDAEAAAAGLKKGVKSKDGNLADIDPIEVDTNVDWNSIGGLDSHIHALKEMVVLPLLYPELFERFHVQPPKGVLFYGPPGTGKTLVARALANTCSATGQKVAFFMRKGADVLSKWVGEAERQLKLLFEEAHAQAPSIIFFDELDGLAPVRSSRQDQIHASIVSTLLALMDGLDNRGQVIVIGATNRVDSIDPALRRPGRFDRELMFSLPNKQARRTILEIHTRDWNPRPEPHFLHSVADLCVGYCGADLRALCTEATLRAVRRKYPQIYQSTDKLAIDVQAIKLKQCDFLDAMRQIVPASHRSANVHARTIPPHLAPLLQPMLDEMIRRVKGIFPLGAVNKSAQANATDVIVESDEEMEDVSNGAARPAMSPAEVTLDVAPSSFPLASSTAVATSTLATAPLTPATALAALPPRPTLPLPLKPRFLLHGNGANMGQSHLGPALLHHFEEFAIFSLDLPLLLGDANAKNAEESCVRIVQECKRNAPSVLYWPHIDLWWSTASESLQNTVLMLMTDLPPNSCIFLFATADCTHDQLPQELLALFPLLGTIANPNGVTSSLSSLSSSVSSLSFEIPRPTGDQVSQFLHPILSELKRDIPRMREVGNMSTLPQLPKIQKVPKPGQTNVVSTLTPEQEVDQEASLTSLQVNLKIEQEDSLIRLQRMSFRGILQRLLKGFPEFEYPVPVDKFPDYLEIVPQPICLQDILKHVNEDHSFDTVSKLLLEIDLMVSNCKEFSVHRKNEFRSLVNKACHLQDQTLSMVSQLETKLTQQCELISKRRAIRKARHIAAIKAADSHAPAPAATRITRSKSTTETAMDLSEDAPVKAETSADAAAPMEVDSDEKQQNKSATVPAAAAASPPPPSSVVVSPITVAPTGASSSSAPMPSPSPPVVLLPPPPPIQLDARSLAKLHETMVAKLTGKSIDQVEMIGFQTMKIVIEYQMKPNRDEAILQIQQIAAEFANLK